MRRVIQTVSLVVCLAVVTEVPRGLLLAAIAVGIGIARTVYAQQPGAPAFDVVSIKRNVTGVVSSTMRPEPNGITGINVTPMRLFRIAYQAADFQILGAPAWFDAERYDVTARTTTAVSPGQLAPLVRSLLADRFGLRVEQGPREVAGFELRVDRANHPGLKPSTEPCSGAPGGPPPGPGGRACFSAIDGEITGRGVPMAMTVRELAGYVRQPIVDRTDLPGVFDYDLRWSEVTAGAPANPDAPPLVTAVREQLGLRLVPARVTIDAYVITAATRPSEN